MIVSSTLTNTRVEIRDNGSEGNDEQLEVLSAVRPVLWIQVGVGRLGPQNFGAIGGQLQLRCNYLSQFNLRLSDKDDRIINTVGLNGRENVLGIDDQATCVDLMIRIEVDIQARVLAA